MTQSQETQKPAQRPKLLKMERLIVATDFSQPATRALDFALLLARQFGMSLKLIHVHRGTTPSRVGSAAGVVVSDVPTPTSTSKNVDIQTRLERLVQQCTDLAVSTTCELVSSKKAAEEAIVSAAIDHAADLIVMGTHGRSGLRRAVSGSVAERVLRRAPMPVVVVPMGDHPW
jgi:nucleotide-binding universal stress UspA family protein